MTRKHNKPQLMTAEEALANQREILRRAVTVLQEEVRLLDQTQNATWQTVAKYAKATELARGLLESHDDE